MAGRAERLKLSDLKPNMDYPLENSIPEGRCLIHVKLTDFCARSVENLIHSDKVCCFCCCHVPVTKNWTPVVIMKLCKSQ